MNSTRPATVKRQMFRALLGLLVLPLATSMAMASVKLQGQNKGDTNNWYDGNLQYWAELDFIPCRVYFSSGSAGSQTIRVDFERRNGGVPGIQNLFDFTPSPNAVLTAGPTLSAPPSADTWSYTFTVNITDNQPASVFFFARLAAGAHLNTGSSLALRGKPSSMGTLQIHKPGPAPGAPDLVIVKSGPPTAQPGQLINYSLFYTNIATATAATGVQVTDILPPEITVIPASLPTNALVVGNTIFWEFARLLPGARGQINFQAQISPSVVNGQTLQNFAQILSAENDANYANNSSTFTTTIVIPCVPATIAGHPLSQAVCEGEPVMLAVAANGTAPLAYQWRKDGAALPDATDSTLLIPAVSPADLGDYDVVVVNPCGSITSTVATVSLNESVSATPLTSQTNCPGATVTFSTTATGPLPISYQWFKDGVLLPGQMMNSLTLSNITPADAGLYTVVVAGGCNAVTNSARLDLVPAPGLICAPDKTIECTGEWAFDEPTILNGALQSVITVVTNLGGNILQATRTWTVTNICGNAAQCSQTVTVVDTTPPVITCAPNKTVELGTAWSFDTPTVSDGTLSVVGTVTNAGCGQTFSAVRTWRATDACGNSAECSQTVTVVDTTPPVITCAANKTVELGTAWSFDTPTVSDGTLSVVGTVTNAGCGQTFTAVRTWRATDACGNSAECSQTVTVVDTTPPVITCAPNKTVELGTAWSFDTPTVSDGTLSVVGTVTNAGCGQTFTAVRTWRATDACGNSAECSQTVTVVDTTPPVITCAPNKTVELGTSWTFDTPTVSDGTLSVVGTVTNAGCGQTFTAVRTWRATDGCGNSAECSQTVTVVDTTPPVITCAANKTVELGTSWTFDTPTVSDGTLSVVGTVTNAGCGQTFTAVRTWRATDACGNSAECSQTVTVVDTTPPVITCAPNKTVELGTSWTFDTPTVSDGTLSVVGTVTNAGCGQTFSAVRTWRATDACGNSAECSQTVTVVDTTPPVITCAANKTVELGTAWTFDTPTVSDGTLSVVGTVTNAGCGQTFTAVRTWRATDACGNSAECSQTVTVVDTTPPVITCAPNKTVELGTAWTFDTPTVSDGTLSVVGTVTNAGCGQTFSAVRTWRATDACGNSAECSQTVTVVDTTPPVITCAPNKTVELGTAWSFDTPTVSDGTLSVVGTVTNAGCGQTFTAVRTWRATDACGNSAECSQTVTVVDTTPPVITCAPNKTVELGTSWTFDTPTVSDGTLSVVGTVTNAGCGQTFSAVRTWRATDACGNSAECSQTVTVVDTTPPVITCAPNKTVELGTAWTFDTPTVSDGTLSVVGTVTNAGCGQTFTAVRTWRATDACGNSAECSQTVTVVDTTPPVITCAPNKTVELGTSWTFDTPTVSDGTLSVVGTVTNAGCGQTFSAVRTWRATDACGNSAECSQTVTVVDTTPPVITCAPNKTVELGTAWSFDTPTVSDGTLSVVGTVTNAGCGQTFSAVRTWRATDACGNSAECSQTVTVVDTTPPVITCAPNKTVELGTAWSFDTPTVSDGTLSVVGTVTNAGCGQTFSAVRTWRATDACGNSAECSQTVTVVDTTPPVITCAPNKTVELGTAWSFDTPTVSDGTLSVVGTVTNAGCGQTFTAVRTWRATDACGNSAECSQTVTVVDTTPPVITCAPNKTVELGTSWTFDTPTVSDGTLSVVGTVTNAGCGQTFTAIRTWRATDACGNSAECSQTVTVVDTTPPVITCAPNKTVELGTAWSFDTPTVSDGTLSVVGTVTNAGCGQTFTAVRTWRATDACGNSAECSQTVTVVDTTPPVITCAPNKTVELGTAWSFDTPTVSDGTLSVVGTVTNAGCGQTFTAIRTWRATDACGNSAECSQTVTVVDTTPPVITCAPNKTVELGTAWSFDTPTVSDGTLSVVGTVTNAGCGQTFTAIRTWRATDACGNSAECSQTVTVVDTTPPTVEILIPTNGTVFIAPANIQIVANASDANGIARVEFYYGTNKLAETAGGSLHELLLTNVPAGVYALDVMAVDLCGWFTRVTNAVTVTVLEQPPFEIVMDLRLNPRTGLYEQRVRVFNPTTSSNTAARLYVLGLPAQVQVYNRSGITNGVPYVQSNTGVPPGGYLDLVIEFYTSGGVIPNPQYRAEFLPLPEGGGAAVLGIPQPVRRGTMLSNGTFQLEFLTQAGRTYAVQYSSDLVTWQTSEPLITGNGGLYIWIDNGQPKTQSAPAATPYRFYRVLLLQP